MRAVHRIVALFAVLFGLYVGFTGTLLQLIDLKAILSHAPATDPNLAAIREGRDGPPNFVVIADSDYAAAPLPAAFDFDGALARVVKSERNATGGAPMSFVQLRMQDDKPEGQIASNGKLLRFDAVTGAVLAGPANAQPVILPPQNHPSLRNTVKNFHRFLAFGDWPILIDIVAGLMLLAMLFSGLTLYFQLLFARSRTGRASLFWSAGGWWRALHRGIAIVASILLIVVTITGTIEAIGTFGVSAFRMINHGRPGLTADVSSPLRDAELPGMLRTTLAAYRAADPGVAVKTLRLRYFAGMPQGVVVAGPPSDTRQWAFNAATGHRAPLYQHGYPLTGQIFGWRLDQIFKGIHRGDFIGMPGRWLSLLAGLSLLFLSVSGIVMYVDLWIRRRRLGRAALFWS